MLVYSAITSLDGYTTDPDGNFEWSAPDEEVLAFLNDRERPIGTYLYGRLMYEVMHVWENVDLDGQSAAFRDYAGIWRAADKIVYSSSLPDATTGTMTTATAAMPTATARTRVERSFDPEAVRALKERGDVSIGGPTLAAHAIRAGLVDVYELYVTPFIVGGGLAALPAGVRVSLDLVDEHRFASGVVYLRYRSHS
jgi:dihydrofolate reductase